jgi:hypothetical protein
MGSAGPLQKMQKNTGLPLRFRSPSPSGPRRASKARFTPVKGGDLRFTRVYFTRLAAWTSTNSESGWVTMVVNMMPLMMSDQAVSQ